MNTRLNAAMLAAGFYCALSGPALAQLRELTTDRPDQTESPISVDKGHYQLEMDFFNMTRDRERDGGLDLRTIDTAVSAFNFKYGLTDNTDIQFVFDTYLHSKTKNVRNGALVDKTDGVGDLTIRYKYNFFGNDGGNAFALMPFVKVPTASNGLGNKKVEGGVIVPYAFDVGNAGVGVMTEVDYVRNSTNTGYNVSFFNTATVGFDLTERIGMYTELALTKSTESGEKWQIQGDLGFTFAISDTANFDIGANVGLNKAAPDFNPFVGLSVKF
jgi:hypothetical protein